MEAPKQALMAGGGAQHEALLDWSWTEATPPPTLYNPPQFKPGFVPLSWVAWYTQTSACCTRPAIPCCGASAIRYLCNCDAEDVSLLSPDAAIRRMLSNPNPNCPERLRGVWWMEGNQLNQEVLMTFEDADWLNETSAVKNSYENWMRTPSCFGIINATANHWKKGQMKIAVSPDMKWVTLDGYKIYVLGPGEKLVYPDGTEVPRTDADMMRIDFNGTDTLNPTYQYMVRRVAYLDSSGALVKTSNYNMLQDLVSKGRQRIEACPPQYFVCGDPAEAMHPINPWAIIRWPVGSKP